MFYHWKRPAQGTGTVSIGALSFPIRRKLERSRQLRVNSVGRASETALQAAGIFQSTQRLPPVETRHRQLHTDLQKCHHFTAIGSGNVYYQL